MVSARVAGSRGRSGRHPRATARGQARRKEHTLTGLPRAFCGIPGGIPLLPMAPPMFGNAAGWPLGNWP